MDLRTFGFAMSNDAFAYHSWYFRNALVRANYNNLAKGITATTEYIERFFRNLLLGEDNELKNRYLQVCRPIARLQYHQKRVGTRWRNGSLRQCTPFARDFRL